MEKSIMEREWDFDIIQRNIEGFLDLSQKGNIRDLMQNTYQQFTETVLQTGSQDVDEVTEALLALGELRHIIKLNFKGNPHTDMDKVFGEMIRITQEELKRQAKDIFGPKIQADEEILEKVKKGLKKKKKKA